MKCPRCDWDLNIYVGEAICSNPALPLAKDKVDNRKYTEVDGKYYKGKRYVGSGNRGLTDEEIDEAIRVNKTGITHNSVSSEQNFQMLLTDSTKHGLFLRGAEEDDTIEDGRSN